MIPNSPIFQLLSLLTTTNSFLRYLTGKMPFEGCHYLQMTQLTLIKNFEGRRKVNARLGPDDKRCPSERSTTGAAELSMKIIYSRLLFLKIQNLFSSTKQTQDNFRLRLTFREDFPNFPHKHIQRNLILENLRFSCNREVFSCEFLGCMQEKLHE